MLALWLSSAGALFGEDAPAAAPGPPRGPLPLRNLHPLTLPFYQPLAAGTETLAPGGLALQSIFQYASVQRFDQVGGERSRFDGEILRASLELRCGLPLEGLELSLELPALSRGAGFLDGVVKGFHNRTGLREDTRNENEFAESLRVRGVEVLDEDPLALALADIPIALKWELFEDASGQIGFALRAGLELPTGDRSRWVGSGTVEGAIGALAQKTFGEVTIAGGCDLRLLPAPPRWDRAGLELAAAPAVVAAVDWHPFSWASFVAQIDFAEQLVGETRLRPLRKPQVQGTLGMRLALGAELEGLLGISEDLVEAASPDVAFVFGFSWRPRAGS